ncbi:MAG: hypothetical protein M3296_07550 [Actinomycetota bacterium]|nr:hypothetical protein [Actinomycetota bacterium]
MNEAVRPLLGSLARRLRPLAARWPSADPAKGAAEDHDTERLREADLPGALSDAEGRPIQHAVLVAVPVEIAYNQFTQFEDFPDFMRTVAKAEQIDAVQVSFEVRRWGMRRRWRAHVLDQRPEERIAWRSVSGARLAGVTTFHAIAPRLTRVDAGVVVEGTGRAQRIARRVGLVDRAIVGELKRFKAFIEMREQETGAWRGYIADGRPVTEDEYFGWGPGERAAGEDAPADAAKASRSNGASARRSAHPAGPAGGSHGSGAGPTRAGAPTGGSRTTA